MAKDIKTEKYSYFFKCHVIDSNELLLYVCIKHTAVYLRNRILQPASKVLILSTN